MDVTVAVREKQSRWLAIYEALRGSHQDYTVGSLNRAILLLTIPMVLEMALESLFAVVDIFWVARLNSNAVVAVGLTESMMTLVFAIGMGLSISTTAMVSRRIGEKNPEAAAVVAVQAIILCSLISIAIGIPCMMLTPHLLHGMGASPEIVQLGSGYARVALGGCGVLLMLFLNNAIFRGTGDAAIAMRLLWVSNIINLILDPCLIFGLGPFPKLGVTGAALATLTGRSIGVGYQFYSLFRGTERIHILWRQLKLVPSVLWQLLSTASTGILQFVIAQTSWIGLIRIVALFGSAAVAGYTIAFRVILFVILPSWGFSNAAATLVGQNLGADDPERAEKAVWRTSISNIIFLGTISIFLIIFGGSVVHLFTDNPQVLKQGTACLRILSCGNIAYAFSTVILQSLNGAGDTVTPTLVNLFGLWILEIPLAWWLAVNQHNQASGVYWSMVVGQFAIAGTSYILFRRGRWKIEKV